MKMENNYWIVDEWLIFKPDFNEELIDYCGVINKYKKIMFSNYDDFLIAIETNNQYTDEYCANFIKNNFNQEIDLSNNINLIYLTFGFCFVKEIFIPLNVKSLNMCECNNQYVIDNLRNNVEELIISNNHLNLDNLPNSIKKLYIEDYEKELNNLPNSIEYLELNNYELKIKKIPKNLKTVKCNKEYKYMDDFKNYTVLTY